MTTILAPSLVLREWDNNGNPLANGKVFTYAAGTTTPQATFTDSTGSTQNPNPTILNSRGEAQVWMTPNLAYKFLIQDSAGNQIRIVDQVTNSQLLTLFGGVDVGAANAYILNFTAAFSSLVNGIVIEWIPANTNTTAATLTVNGLATSNLVNPDGTALLAGQIVAGMPASVMFYNGNWLLLAPPGTVRFGVAGANGMTAWGTNAAAYLDISSDTGSWTTTLSGPYTTNPTGILKWSRVSRHVTIWAETGITGVTTSAALITASGLPAQITPSAGRSMISVGGNDKGVVVPISVQVLPNNTLTLAPVLTANAANPTAVNAGATNTWDSGQNTGINGFFSITYSL